MNSINKHDNETFLFTSESVGEGHPGMRRRHYINIVWTNFRFWKDKICDQISDAVLDAHLEQDPDAKVACGEAYFTISCALDMLPLEN